MSTTIPSQQPSEPHYTPPETGEEKKEPHTLTSPSGSGTVTPLKSDDAKSTKLTSLTLQVMEKKKQFSL